MEDKMSLIQQKIKAKKLFKKLCGQGVEFCVRFQGGLFEEKRILGPAGWEGDFTFDERTSKHIQEVVSCLPEEDANNVDTILLFHNRVLNGYSFETEYLKAWLMSSNIKKETRNNSFIKIIDSFKSLDNALDSWDLYQSFLSPTIMADHPWTLNHAEEVGYRVFPYFEAAGILNGIMPQKTKDQYAYQEMVARIKEKGRDALLAASRDGWCIENLPRVLIGKCPPSSLRNILSKYQGPMKIAVHTSLQNQSRDFSKIKN